MTHIIWISNLGDAGSFLVPLALACAIWLRVTGKHLALRWLLSLAIGMALVGASKILYAGCGVEISAIQFRMISGHTMLAAAVWPVLLALVAAGVNAGWHRAGTIGGLLLAAAIGVVGSSRMRTRRPKVAGWPLGGAVAVLFLQRLFSEPRKMPRVLFAGIALLACC